jgi:hypothetical protein
MAIVDSATYEAPGRSGSPVELQERCDNSIGGEWVAPTTAEYRENLTPFDRRAVLPGRVFGCAGHRTGARRGSRGPRGLSDLQSLMLGSVSHAVLHHADRAVLVVPSSGLADQRFDHRLARRRSASLPGLSAAIAGSQ